MFCIQKTFEKTFEISYFYRSPPKILSREELQKFFCFWKTFENSINRSSLKVLLLMEELQMTFLSRNPLEDLAFPQKTFEGSSNFENIKKILLFKNLLSSFDWRPTTDLWRIEASKQFENLVKEKGNSPKSYSLNGRTSKYLSQ